MALLDIHATALEDGVIAWQDVRAAAQRRSTTRCASSSPPISINAESLQRMQFDPVEYVVPGYIAEGLTLFAGKPKIGKSWLLLNCAIAVSAGGLALGNVPCAGGDVLYASLEDNPRRLKKRMTKLCPQREWSRRLTFMCDMPRLKHGGLSVIRDWVDASKAPRLVIIDTLAKVRDVKKAQQREYDADYEAVTELKALADERRIAIVIVHHQRKMGAEDPIDTVSGTTGLTGAVDTVLVLSRDGQGTTLFGAGRDIEQFEKAVSFESNTCLWRVEGEASVVRRSAQRRAVLKVLMEAGAPMSPAKLAPLVNSRGGALRKLLHGMTAAGEVQKAAHGKYVHASRPDLLPGGKGSTPR